MASAACAPGEPALAAGRAALRAVQLQRGRGCRLQRGHAAQIPRAARARLPARATGGVAFGARAAARPAARAFAGAAAGAGAGAGRRRRQRDVAAGRVQALRLDRVRPARAGLARRLGRQAEADRAAVHRQAPVQRHAQRAWARGGGSEQSRAPICRPGRLLGRLHDRVAWDSAAGWGGGAGINLELKVGFQKQGPAREGKTRRVLVGALGR